MFTYTEPRIHITTDQLLDGDILSHYGALFILENGRAYVDPQRPNDLPVYVFDTRCINPQSFAEPKWAKGWTIQGNARAYWSRVNR